MSLTGFTDGLARGVGALVGRQSLGSIATIVTIVVFIVVILVSVLGDGDDAEPKQVMKIEQGPVLPAGTGGPGPGPLDATSTTMSLVAVNGVVISDAALIEMVVEGPLPRIAADGRKAMDVYARAFDRDDPRPKIALVVGGLGLGEAVTQAAVDRLPAGVTFAVTPYGSALQALVSAARSKGHEVLLEVPLEPYDYPDNDPGQDTLLTGATAAENPARLRRVLSKVTGYAGLINSQGAKYLSSEAEVRELLATASGRGLYFVDSGEAEQSRAREIAQASGAPFARADRRVDQEPTQKAIEAEFAQLEELAKSRGFAIGFASAFPVTVDRVSVWAQALEEKGIALVPVSALLAAPAAVAPAPAVRAVPEAAPRRSAPSPRTTSRTAKPPPARPQRAKPQPAEPEPAGPPPDPAPIVLPTDPQPFEPSSEPAAPHP